jgi:hypothetical protein
MCAVDHIIDAIRLLPKDGPAYPLLVRALNVLANQEEEEDEVWDMANPCADSAGIAAPFLP